MWSDSPFHKAPNYILNRLICFCWILYSSLQYVLFIPVYNQTMFSYFSYIYLGGRGVVCFCAPSILIKYRGWAAHIRSFCSVFCTVFFFQRMGFCLPFWWEFLEVTKATVEFSFILAAGFVLYMFTAPSYSRQIHSWHWSAVHAGLCSWKKNLVVCVEL